MSLILLISLLWPGWLLAQNSEIVTIDDIETIEMADGIRLRIFFTVTSEKMGGETDSSTLLSAAVSQAAIQLEDGSTYPARLQTLPHYIALVLDASGSMEPVFGEMQQAAIDLVNAAPPEVAFAIIEFDETLDLLQPYTTDHEQLINAINRIEITDNGTCLYDVALTAAQSLEQIAQDTPRRALVIFTDGQDQIQQGSSQTCSRITDTDLSDYAADQAQPLPIYTVGIAEREADVNSQTLAQVAAATGGFFINSAEEDFSSQLQNVLADIGQHGLAEVTVQPGAGVQRGSLLLTLSDGRLPAPGPILFTSSADYRQPETPAEQAIHISNFRYNSLSDSFQFDTALTNLNDAATLIAEAVDQVDNVQVERTLIANPAVLQSVRLDAANMTAGDRYQVMVTAQNAAGKLLVNADGSPVTDIYEFRYDPPQPLSLQIDSVTIEDEPARLNIEALKLEDDVANLVVEYHTSGEPEVSRLNGRLLNQANNQRTDLFPLTPAEPGIAQAPIAVEDGRYILVVYALDENGNVLTTDNQPFTFTSPDNTVIRSGRVLQSNPLLLLFFLILAAAVGFFSWRFGHSLGHNTAYKSLPAGLNLSALKSKEEPEEVEAPPQAALVLVSSPDPSLAENGRWQIDHFPFTIGRDEGDITIPGDRHVSRKHARITFENNDYFIEDLGSSNGTFVNDTQIATREAMPLRTDKSTRIQIGKTTSFIFKVEIEAVDSEQLTVDSG